MTGQGQHILDTVARLRRERDDARDMLADAFERGFRHGVQFPYSKKPNRDKTLANWCARRSETLAAKRAVAHDGLRGLAQREGDR